MLTTEHIEGLVQMAGWETDPATGRKVLTYAWNVPGCSRPASTKGKGNARRGACAWLASAQGGLCTDCGEALDMSVMDQYAEGYVETSHIVAGGMEGGRLTSAKGWMIGNLMACHRECPSAPSQRGNRAQYRRGPVVLPQHLLRPDLVFTGQSPYPSMGRFAAHDPRHTA